MSRRSHCDQTAYFCICLALMLETKRWVCVGIGVSLSLYPVEPNGGKKKSLLSLLFTVNLVLLIVSLGVNSQTWLVELYMKAPNSITF